MLVECGFVRAIASDGREWSFTPSFGRVAALGAPHEIVEIFAGLHGPRAAEDAAHVLACLCDQEDPSPLIGEPVAEEGAGIGWRPGLMPAVEQVVIARHLMQHGIVGTARPGKGDGQFSTEFHAAEYIAAARVHLGLSSGDAEALSMTEFQKMFEMKFPGQGGGERKRDVPSREEYAARVKAEEERRRAA